MESIPKSILRTLRTLRESKTDKSSSLLRTRTSVKTINLKKNKELNIS